MSSPNSRPSGMSSPLPYGNFTSDQVQPTSELSLPTTPTRAGASGSRLPRLSSPVLSYPDASSPVSYGRLGSSQQDATDPLLTEGVGASQSSTLGISHRLPRSDLSGSSRLVSRLRTGDQLSSSQDIAGAGRGAPGAIPSSDPSAMQLEDAQIIWGTTISLGESMKSFKKFFTTFRKVDILPNRNDEQMAHFDDPEEDIMPFYIRLLQELKDREIYTVNFDCCNLRDHPEAEFQQLYLQLVRYPQEMIPIIDHTITEVFLDKFPDIQLHGALLRVRPFNIGRSVSMRDLDPADIDQLVTIKGMLIRSSPIIPEMKKAFFRCSVCDQTLSAEVERGRVMEPTRCCNDACKSENTMALIHQRCTFADKQILRIQEIPDETPDGQTPYSVTVMAYDDLADVAKPGDRVEITGVYRGVPVREIARQRAVKSLFRTYIDAMHIKRTDTKRVGRDPTIVEEEEGSNTTFMESDRVKEIDAVTKEELVQLSKAPHLYELLARSVAPSIYGMDDVKKGVLLQLFGGTSRHSQSEDGKKTARVRGDINVLLVGDPGVSKSQLLQYVHRLAPRGIYTSGKGSSAVGLTAYVTRDPDTKQFVLESGALVLSDGGICCIDEFDKMSDSARSILHEVMEQQTISVAKAGIITTLNARTSILAAANPINSKFDERLPIVANINLPAPLMSRFDLLYLVLDKPNDLDDRRLAKHLVELYMEDRPALSNLDYVPIDKFAKYISYARREITPVITEEAGNALVSNYVEMRKYGKTSAGGQRQNIVTATTRQLESMIRLSEAHARMRLSTTVDKIDVDEAYRLIQVALQTSAVDPATGRIDMDLVTTGISARVRSNLSHRRDQLKTIIQNIQKESIRFMEILRLFREQEHEKLSEFELKNLLEDLCDSGTISMRGRMSTDTIITKL